MCRQMISVRTPLIAPAPESCLSYQHMTVGCLCCIKALRFATLSCGCAELEARRLTLKGAIQIIEIAVS